MSAMLILAAASALAASELGASVWTIIGSLGSFLAGSAAILVYVDNRRLIAKSRKAQKQEEERRVLWNLYMSLNSMFDAGGDETRWSESLAWWRSERKAVHGLADGTLSTLVDEINEVVERMGPPQDTRGSLDLVRTRERLAQALSERGVTVPPRMRALH